VRFAESLYLRERRATQKASMRRRQQDRRERTTKDASTCTETSTTKARGEKERWNK